MHDLGRSSVLSRSKAMQSWGEDTFRDIIRDELSVTSEQNQGYHNTTNQLIFYDLEEGDGPKPSVTISFLNKFETASHVYDQPRLFYWKNIFDQTVSVRRITFSPPTSCIQFSHIKQLVLSKFMI